MINISVFICIWWMVIYLALLLQVSHAYKAPAITTTTTLTTITTTTTTLSASSSSSSSSSKMINTEFNNWIGCISYHEIKPILEYKSKVLTSHQSIEFITSIDLGLSKTKIYLDSDGLHSNKKELLVTWDELESIYNKKNGCYAIYDDGSKPWHITTISKSSSIPASLCPPLAESGAPTMVLGSNIFIIIILLFFISFDC